MNPPPGEDRSVLDQADRGDHCQRRQEDTGSGGQSQENSRSGGQSQEIQDHVAESGYAGS
jgi:hypothetical protein